MGKQTETQRAFAEDGARKTHIGGQALIEGVMMRGRYNWALGVREPNGDLYAEQFPLSKKGNRPKWMEWPLVRGCVALADSLVLGFKALEIAANHALVDEDPAEDHGDAPFGTTGTLLLGTADGRSQRMTCGPKGTSQRSTTVAHRKTSHGHGDAPFGHSDSSQARTGHGDVPFGHDDSSQACTGHGDAPFGHSDSSQACKTSQAQKERPSGPSGPSGPSEELGKGEMAFAMALGVALGVALFILAPAVVSNVLVGGYEDSPLAWNLVDGVARVAIFVLYVWLIGRMKDIHRMFSYHGAEHKTIHCYEHGLPLTPENARTFPRLHVRCGTAFLIMVMIIAILVYTIVPLDGALDALGITGAAAFALLIAVRILFVPLIAGISYEVTVKWAGAHPDNPLVRVVLWPGMQMQRLTTNEPDDSMLECAIAAMSLVLEREAAEA